MNRLTPIFVFFLTMATCLGAVAVAQEAVPSSDADAPSTFQKDEVDVAVDKAIRFLTSKQRQNGAILDKSHDTTMTALSIMAMASVGIQPGDPTPDGQAMGKALSFVLQRDRIDDKGYFGAKDGARMYGHGIITLMLTEMLGMGTSSEQDQLIHDRCQQAIDVILSSQKESKPIHFRGGWRYTPSARDADLSVSVWQVMALRSAKNDGLQVPASAIRSGRIPGAIVRFAVGSKRPSGQKASGFCYTPHQNSPSFAMTAAGLLAMQVCGEYDSPLVAGAADWLLEHPPKWKDRFCSYGTYYYAQGMYQRGGKHAQTAQNVVQDMLLEKQSGNGSWTAENGSERSHGSVYATSMAVLSLSVKYHYLPIYQR